MRVLVIENDLHKRSHVLAFLDQFDLEVVARESFFSGREAVEEFAPDVVILDMEIYSYDRDDPHGPGRRRAFGGRDLMSEIAFQRTITKVVVLTGFEVLSDEVEAKTRHDLVRELRARFGEMFLGAVYYSADQTSWQDAVDSMLGLSERHSRA